MEKKTRMLSDNDYKINRVLIVGAGDGGEVVANILRIMKDKDGWKNIYKPVGFLDDNEQLWNTIKNDLPVYGGINKIHDLKNKFDNIIISITSNLKVRKKIFNNLKENGFVFINAIHPSAFISDTASIGIGNIIGAFVYIGHNTIIGNNNLLSSHCSIEHHNQVGSHNVFGPNIPTSGHVTIGDSCLVGSRIMPHIVIGDNVQISGNIPIWTNVSDDSRIIYENKLPWRKVNHRRN